MIYENKKNFLEEITQELFTIKDMIRFAVSQFNSSKIFYGHGTDNPWDEAIQLIFPTLSLPINSPVEINSARLTNTEKKEILKKIFKRIKERIPVSYLTNKSWFCGLEFYVDSRVIIPRSPIGELIVNRFKNFISDTPKQILDMCTGSGCIAIACSYVFQKSKIDAVDISIEALKVAKKNVRIHNMENRISLIHSDLFNSLPLLSYDIIISNPPYVRREELKNLPKEFLMEPIIGLISENNGLRTIQRILSSSSNYLIRNGILVCEVGDHANRLEKIYPEINFNWIKINQGGNGIFVLERKQLEKIKNLESG